MDNYHQRDDNQSAGRSSSGRGQSYGSQQRNVGAGVAEALGQQPVITKMDPHNLGTGLSPIKEVKQKRKRVEHIDDRPIKPRAEKDNSIILREDLSVSPKKGPVKKQTAFLKRKKVYDPKESIKSSGLPRRQGGQKHP